MKVTIRCAIFMCNSNVCTRRTLTRWFLKSNHRLARCAQVSTLNAVTKLLHIGIISLWKCAASLSNLFRNPLVMTTGLHDRDATLCPAKLFQDLLFYAIRRNRIISWMGWKWSVAPKLSRKKCRAVFSQTAKSCHASALLTPWSHSTTRY